MKRRHEQLDPSQIPISQTSNFSSSNDRRHYFSDEHGEIELGTPYSQHSHRAADPHQKKVSIMMMTSESSSQQTQEQLEMMEEEEEEEEVLEGEIQTITSCHSNTAREMHRVALQPVENETSENYDTGTQVLDDG